MQKKAKNILFFIQSGMVGHVGLYLQYQIKYNYITE